MTIAITIFAVFFSALLLYQLAVLIVRLLPLLWALVVWIWRRIKDFFIGIYFVTKTLGTAFQRLLRRRHRSDGAPCNKNLPQSKDKVCMEQLPVKTESDVAAAVQYVMSIANNDKNSTEDEGEDNAD